MPLGLACALLAAALAGAGCSTAHTARPLGKGNQALHLSIGGPVAGVGRPKYYVPLTTLTWKAGLSDRADVFLGWHVLDTFVNNGNVSLDVGASYYFLDQKKARPGLSAAFTVSPLFNRESGWASFDLQLTASWAIGRKERHLLYAGFHNYFTPVRAQLVPTPLYSWSPYIGGQLRLGPKRGLGLSLELKWHRPYADTSRSVIGYLGPGNRGALAFLGGITAYIPKPDPAARAARRAKKAPPADPAPPEEPPPAEPPPPPEEPPP
jgi:hypothetical protein